MEDLLAQMFKLFVMAMTVEYTWSFRLSNVPSNNPNAIADDTNSGLQRRLVFKQALTDPITVVTENNNLVLECEATGSPTPTIHWLVNGNRLPQGHSASVMNDQAYYEQPPNNDGLAMLRLGTTKSRLQLDCVTADDIGVYSCVADSPLDRIASQTYLELERSSGNDVSGCPPVTGTPARIYMWETSRFEFEGADVQLFCRASGYPAPLTTWYDRNGNPIGRENPNYRLLKNGDLLIKRVDWFTHMGVYRCAVTNEHGSDEVTSFLYPTEP